MLAAAKGALLHQGQHVVCPQQRRGKRPQLLHISDTSQPPLLRVGAAAASASSCCCSPKAKLDWCKSEPMHVVQCKADCQIAYKRAGIILHAIIGPAALMGQPSLLSHTSSLEQSDQHDPIPFAHDRDCPPQPVSVGGFPSDKSHWPN